MVASREIPVTLFRDILLVPFAVEARDRRRPFTRSGRELVAELARLLRGSHWTEVESRWLHLPEDETRRGDALAAAYAEFVYFEPYVQRFLFGDRDERPERAPVRLWRRTDVRAMDAAVREPGGDGLACFRFRVDRLNLYLFDTGNAMLVLDLAFDPELARRLAEGHGGTVGSEMSLAVAQTLHERLRRVFPPYFAPFDTTGRMLPEDEGLAAPLFPVAFRPVSGDPGTVAPNFERDELMRAKPSIEHVQAHRCPPLHPTWLELLEPLPVEGYVEGRRAGEGCAKGCGEVVLSQMGDDRAFAHLILGVEDAHAIERSDWVRLAMADEAGSGDPYAIDFLEDFERRHCYDRFYEGDSRMNIRYLFSPYSFAVVGSAAGPERKGHDFFRDVVADHGRRHYFQLALIASFQKTALLTLSERLADALREADADPARFHEAAEAIEQDVLRFTHRYWFEDISAQIQGQELFDRFREHLRTRALYEQVTREVHQANQVAVAHEQREIARKAGRLNRTVFLGLVLTAATGFLGMNVFGTEIQGRAGIVWFLLIALVAAAMFACFWRLPIENVLDGCEDRRRRR
jgi:hypothetical protein